MASMADGHTHTHTHTRELLGSGVAGYEHDRSITLGLVVVVVGTQSDAWAVLPTCRVLQPRHNSLDEM